ncbi:hypothetical protein SAMN00017405_0431 [Desulfonispora thiosulfatigenes DSM 11270]|uniref:Uncharacterized protein n=1 Tax=Desulfonispora thiosulfatigenes DSM 11270 TaxID=656914 RepID=A0A1W1VQC0_DESTI|nr:hypothetical protein [Desulfonispora thiosulfatigenes]SMB95565.1 hypothetical protein SAMN00017405_0431 [Desulfonispora thiosulfatigenes DSM 11270]
MGYVNRTILFYDFKVLIEGKKKELSKEELLQVIKAKLKKEKFELEEGFEKYSFYLNEDKDNPIILDILKMCDENMFCRIGKKKDINNYQRRNFNDLSTKKINLNTDEFLEVFTYFLLDFSSGKITHMFSREAPQIKEFIRFFEHNIKRVKTNEGNYNLNAEIIPIPNNNALEFMDKIKYFSLAEFKFAIPAKELFEDVGIKLGKQKTIKFNELQSETVSIIIAGGDEKLKKDNYDCLKAIIDTIYEEKDNGKNILEKLIVRANIDERVENFDLLEPFFTRQVTLKQKPRTTYIPLEEIFSSLEYIYSDMKPKLKVI